jgi:hypothetical protein
MSARAAAAMAIVIAALCCWAPTVVHGRFALDDFKAFYCAGRVLLAHADPYDALPMARCEASPAPAPLFVARPGFVLPAPLPGYAIVGFAAIAWLPFGVAAALWIVALFASTAAAILLLERLRTGDRWSILVALGVVLVTISWSVGELPPFALLGIALAATGARERSPGLVGVGIVFAMLEPQVGVAIAIAAAALSMRYAIAAGAALAVLAIVSFLALGISENVAYVRDVLPAHMLSELPAYFQYGLPWVLDRLGVSAGPSLLAGRIFWLAMLGVTFWFSRTALPRERPEAALLAAPVFALAGSPFLHLDHVALALPGALWLGWQRSSWVRTAAIVALALPLFAVFLARGTLVLVPIVALWLGTVYGRSLFHGVVTALGATAVTAIAAVTFLATGFGFSTTSVVGLPATIAQTPWAAFVATHYVLSSWGVWLAKAPIWFGIGATAVGFAALGATVRRTVGDGGCADVAAEHSGGEIPTG